jgi:hypothetical protein
MEDYSGTEYRDSPDGALNIIPHLKIPLKKQISAFYIYLRL